MTLALIANRGLHKRPGGWSPKELGTLSLWLDADDATTITISTGVSQWNDKSGNAYHATQGTGANQPTWVKAARNGRAVVRFDGSSGALDGTDALDLGTGGISVAVVATSANSNSFLNKSVTAANAAGEWLMTERNGIFVNGTPTISTHSATSSLNAWNVTGWLVDRASFNRLYRNGTSIGDITTGTPNSTDLNIAAVFRVGYRSDPQYFSGDIAEIVLSLATWSTDERQKVEGYLAHKWGTTASLPAGHPYKSAAP